MFHDIVVPLDGSRLAECVLPHVVAIARACDASVTLLHVLEGDGEDALANPLVRPLRRAEQEAYLAGVVSRLREADVPAKSVLLEGASAPHIINYVRGSGSDLIILSSHGRSGLGHWNVSGVAQKVIQDARTSLLLVRAYQEPQEATIIAPAYQRLLVPLDGSKRAECVLPLAETLARHWDADVLFTHIIPEPQPFPATPASAEDEALLQRVVARRRAAASRYFEQLQARMPTHSHFYLGLGDSIFDAFREIVDASAVDLVLFSAHGRGCSRARPYGRLVTSCIYYGCASVLILQDLPSEEVEPTAAQQAMQESETGSVRRPVAASRREPHPSRAA